MFHRWTNGFSVDDLGAIVGEFDRFSKSDLGKSHGLHTDTGVRRQDTVYIGPDPDLIRSHSSPQNSRGIV